MTIKFRGSTRVVMTILFVVLTLCPLPFALGSPQEVVDKMVATVNAGVVPECRNICLITYSDLLWQLALQPDTPLANPTSTDLKRSLTLLIDQRLILQEAEKLPSIEPTAEEVKTARDELVKRFPSLTEFQQRLQRVGLNVREVGRDS